MIKEKYINNLKSIRLKTKYTYMLIFSLAIIFLLTFIVTASINYKVNNSTTFTVGRNLYATGNLSVFDLEVRSGQSIRLAGATFENEGHYTSVDTNWIVDNLGQTTSFIGAYANNYSPLAAAVLVLESLNSTFNLVKNSPLHPTLPNMSAFVNGGGNLGIFVEHGREFEWFHYENLTKDEFGNIISLEISTQVMSLNDTHFDIREANIFSLAGTDFLRYNVSVGGINFTGIIVNDDFSVENTINGSITLSTVNNDSNENSSAALEISDYLQQAFSIHKFNSNYAIPSLTTLSSNYGKMKLLAKNNNNDSLTGISFGFFDAEITSPTSALQGFENETIIMDIFNDSVNIFTNLNVSGTIFKNGEEVATLDDLVAGNVTVTSIESIKNIDTVSLISGTPVEFVDYNLGLDRQDVLRVNNSNKSHNADCLILGTVVSGGNGQCVVFGKVTGVDTSGWNVEDDLYLNDTSGTLTNVRPSTAECVQKIGSVLRSNLAAGIIWVSGAGRCNDVGNSINITGNIVANYFFGNGSQLTGLTGSQISDDGTFLLTTGDIATGNYTFDTNTFHIDADNNRVGIGTATPSTALDVIGNAEINGNITMTGDYFNNANGKTITLSRTLPTTVNGTVDIGSFYISSGARSLWISITVSDSSISIAKEYLLPIQWNQNGGTWQIALPISDTGVSGANDFDLDVNVTTHSAYLRIRKTSGSTAGTAFVTIKDEEVGEDVFTPSNATSSVTPPTTYFENTLITQVNDQVKVYGDLIVNNSDLFVDVSSGRVGIGTATPSHELNVVGDANITGNITADYFIGDGSQLNTNSSTWWAGLSGWVEGWFVQTGNNLDFNETKLNETIDARSSNLWTNESGVAAYNGSAIVRGDLNVTGNLTLGQKIIFELGGFIQNIISGQIDVNGTLNVTGNLSVGGDLNVDRTIYADSVYGYIKNGETGFAERHIETGVFSSDTISLIPDGTIVSTQWGMDGLRLFVTTDDSYIYQYNLTVPYDISTATYSSNNSFTDPANTGWYTLWNDDGTVFWHGGRTARKITLTNPWDISSIASDASATISFRNPFYLYDLQWRSDGMRVYGLGYNLDDPSGDDMSFIEWGVTTPYDFDTKYNFNDDDYPRNATIHNFPDGMINAWIYRGFDISPDGKRVYASTNTGVEYELVLGTAWNLSTAVVVNNLTRTEYVELLNYDISPDASSITSINSTGTIVQKKLGLIVDGKVGIGTDNPSHELNVVGDVNVTGNITFGDKLTTGKVELDMTKYLLGTGILEGGLISKNAINDSWLDVTAGKGIFVNYSDINDPVVEYFTWENQSFYPEVNGYRSKWIGFRKNTTGGFELVAQLNFTQEEKRTVAIIGRCISTDALDSCNVPGKYVTPAFGDPKSMEDLFFALGSINIGGNLFTPNGSNLLLDRSGGWTFRYSASFGTNPTSPNVYYNEPSYGITNYAYHLQGSIVTTAESDIDPDYYDLDGVKTAVTTNKWTVQELWFFPVSRTTHVIYGQEVYNSKGDATQAISSEQKVINEEVLDGAIRRGYLVVRQGSTDLSDTDEAVFYEAGIDSAGGTYYWELNSVLKPAENVVVELSNNFSVNETFHVDVSTGYIGIGTNTPEAIFHIYENTSNYESGGYIIEQAGEDDMLFQFKLTNRIQYNMGIAFNETGFPFKITGEAGAIEYLSLHNRTFYISDDVNLSVDNNTFFVDAGNERVGIGTTSPSEELVVSVTGNSTPSIIRVESVLSTNTDVIQGIHLFKDYSGDYGWKIESSGEYDTDATLDFISSQAGVNVTRLTIERDTGYVGIGTETPSHTLNVIGKTNITDDLIVDETDLFVDISNGRVGMGTSSPAYDLDIHNSAGSSLRLNATAGQAIHSAGLTYDIEYTDNAGNAIMEINSKAGDGTSDSVYRFGINSGSTGRQDILLYEPSSIDIQAKIGTSGESTYFNAFGGNFGIGTITPSHQLEVDGDVNLNDTLYVDGSGNVGIGTDSPDADLHVVNTGAAASVIVERTGGYFTHLLSGAAFSLLGFNDSSYFQIGSVSSKGGVTSTDTSLTIDSSGNLGIGISPTEKLDLLDGNFLQRGGTSSDTYSPEIVSTFNVGNDPEEVKVVGSYAYILESASSLFRVVNVHDPSNPALVSTVSTTTSSPEDFDIANNFAYAVDPTDGELIIIDLVDPSSVHLDNITSIGSEPKEIEVRGGYAYIIDSTDDQLIIMDVANTGAPFKTDNISLGCSPYSFDVVGSYAYIGCWGGVADIEIYDISDPYNPIQMLSVFMGIDILTLEVSNNYIYAAENDQSPRIMYIFDATDVTSLNTVSNVSLGASGRVPQDIKVVDGYAYMTTSTDPEILVFDVSNPENPSLIGASGLVGSGNSVDVSGRYAYITEAGTHDDFQIYDISGIDVQSAHINSLLAGGATFLNNIVALEDMAIKGGLDVGYGGINSEGSINTRNYFKIIGFGQEPNFYMEDETFNNELRIHVGNVGGNFRIDDDQSASNSVFQWFIDNSEVMELDSTGNLDIAGTVIPDNYCGVPSGTFTAEESAVLNDASYEWSFGNGATGTAIKSVQPCNGTVTAMSWSCVTNGTNTDIAVSIDSNGSSGCNCVATGGTCYTNCVDTDFNQGQGLQGYTVTAGGASNCVITWWARYD